MRQSEEIFIEIIGANISKRTKLITQLKFARNLISSFDSWTQGFLACDKRSHECLPDGFFATKWSLWGACIEAVGRDNKELYKARDVLARAIIAKKNPFYYDLDQFNDTSDHAAVLSVLDFAITHLESEVSWDVKNLSIEKRRVYLPLLKAARDLIADPNKWTQHSLAQGADRYGREPESREAVKWCGKGAIKKCFNNTNGSGWAMEFIRKVCPVWTPTKNLAHFNDTHTHDEVMIMFNDAVTIAESST